MKESLPEDPDKRAAVLSAYVDTRRRTQSPAVNKFHTSFEEHEESLDEAVVSDIKEIIDTVKRRRSDEARTTIKVLTSAVSGQNMARRKSAAKSLSTRLGINSNSIRKSKVIRTHVLHSEQSAYTYTKRKTRSDAIDEGTKRMAYDYWVLPENSRVTNNKNDIKRVRIGPKMYSSHPSHILERTQTEIFLQFKQDYPETKMEQRAFEKCKPYFVRPAANKDKATCCCRTHVETRSLFKTCMQYRKKVASHQRNRNDNPKTYDSLSDLVDATLCPRSANTHQNKLACLNRECSECGVSKLQFPEETNIGPETVNWERYEYTNVKIKGNNVTRKLILVKKSTNPSEMFGYFKSLLEKFPGHQFRANWQCKQMKSLIRNIPIGHCVTIHDFSENYKCTSKNEIQSSYYQKSEVSLHVTIIHRHAVLEIDGMSSSENEPHIVTEQFFVVSPDQTHDQHFTHAAQKLVCEYLTSISCDVSTMHEFSDGCSVQYKSRHCLGDISYATADFGYRRLKRNFFETAHGRGPQDAAGGFVKKQTDLAVVRGTHIIQTAQDVFEFASKHLQKPSETAKCSRRVFRYLETVNRDRNRSFRPVKNNRQIHQACSMDGGKIKIRNLSCYTCDKCVDANYEQCLNDEQIGHANITDMVNEANKLNDPATAEDDEEEEDSDDGNIRNLVCCGQIIAVKAEDKTYPYYLMKTSSHSYTLRKPTIDKWNTSYPSGIEVIRGYYFDAIADNPLHVRLIKRIPAIVPSHSLLYICSEIDIEENDTMLVGDSLHRRILRCID